MLRPGRLDKILYVGLPSSEDRADILRAVTKVIQIFSIFLAFHSQDSSPFKMVNGKRNVDLILYISLSQSEMEPLLKLCGVV